jgi:hypothetical protein
MGGAVGHQRLRQRIRDRRTGPDRTAILPETAGVPDLNGVFGDHAEWDELDGLAGADMSGPTAAKHQPGRGDRDERADRQHAGEPVRTI